MMATTNDTRVKVPAHIPADLTTSPNSEMNDVGISKPCGGMSINSEDNSGISKPYGRMSIDGSESIRENKFLKCKRTLKISTMNTRTLRKPSLQVELCALAKKYKIDVIGIQEHRIVHSDDSKIQYENLVEGYQLVTISAWRNSAGAAVGGIGLLLSTTARKSLISIQAISPRLMEATFNGNPKTTVMVTYSPTNVAEEDEVKEYYSSLTHHTRSIPAHNVLIVLGDFNAQIGLEDAKFSYHDNTNRNGEQLLSYAQENNLVITNTTFQKKQTKLWTCELPSGFRAQLDYILVRHKWKNSVTNSEAYNTFASIGSDHRIVTAYIRLSLRASGKTPAKVVKYDWKVLTTDPELQDKYTVEVKNRFSILTDDLNGDDPTEKYECLIKANEEAAKKFIPHQKRKHQKALCYDKRVEEARQHLKEVYEKHVEENTQDSSEDLEQSKNELDKAYEVANQDYLKEKLAEFEAANLNQQHHTAWQLINEISGRRKARGGRIKGDTKEARVENWYNHFKQLLGEAPSVIDEDEEIPNTFRELPIRTDPFDKEEYIKAKNSIKEGKSFGADGIPPEVVKRCNLDDIILDFCNGALLNGLKPEQWSILNIIPVPKSGDLSNTANYRGISLSSMIAKTFNRMLLNRIRPHLDTKLRPNQCGFREGRSTISQILALRRLIEGIQDKNLTAVLTFIDFKKAFDMIHRGKMIMILKSYGIPDIIVDAIDNTYQNTRAKVITPDGETEEFNILAGVLQGDTLAPYLFITVLDYCLRSAISGKEEDLGFTVKPRQTRRVGPLNATDLDFADDIALISDTEVQAQKLLERVEDAALRVGLHMNAKKTKCMVYNHNDEINIRTRDGTRLEVVNDFKYLGSWMESSKKDIQTRKALAWQACNKLNKIWKSTLTRNLKIKLFLATVESVLLYGSETWTLTARLQKSIDGCYTRLLRSALNVSWKDRIPNTVLYKDLPRVSEKIRERRLKFAGHCSRSKDQVVADLVLWKPSQGKRSKGRPIKTYLDLLCEDTGLMCEDLESCMQERTTWRAIADVRWKPPE